MKSQIEGLFGIHERALLLRERRAELLAHNLANADTPHYKARDVDFRAVLAGAQAETGIGLIRTSVRHLAGAGADPVLGEPLYRVPAQPSIDGNSVDPDSERSAFLDNSLRYQASLQFVDGRIRRLTAALRGE